MNKECISTRQFDISFSGNVLVTRLEEIDYLFIYLLLNRTENRKVY